MAVQILNDPGQWASAGANLGAGLGGGLSQTLGLLAQNKIQKMHQSEEQAKLAQTFQALGLPPELASLPPQVQSAYVKQKLQEPQNQAFGQFLQNQIGGNTGASQSPDANFAQPSGLPGLQGGTPLSGGNQMQQLNALGGQQAAGPNLAGLNPKQQLEATKIILEQQKESRKEFAAEKRLAAEEKRAAFKETKVERKEIIEKAKVARQTLSDLERFEELQKEGKLDTPGYVEFLKRSGLDIPALMNPGSEEFNKIQANFLRDAKTYFGGRISNFEVDQFLKTLPNLSQSNQGRSRVIANLKRINRVALEHNTALKDVMSENKGVPPLDLLEKVDAKIEKKLDAIANQFKRDLAKPVPAGQNKLVTALQAGAGSVLGVPGKILGGVGKLIGGLIG